MRILLLLLLIKATFLCVHGSCDLHPVLQGVSVTQPLGFSNKKVFVKEPDCKARCAEETDFTCQAMMWPGQTGDCYIMDKVWKALFLFKDGRQYILYVEVCDGEPTPSVGYCEFIMVQADVTRTTDIYYESPGATTETSCQEFCISNYRGIQCQAFIVSEERASTCTLYDTTPTDLESGSQRLWNKTCKAAPDNCVYTEWAEWGDCSQNCELGQRTRNREIEKEGSEDGVQCLESETTATEECGSGDCTTDTDCVYTKWGKWETCASPSECGQGTTSRYRSVKTEASGTGVTCDEDSLSESKLCDTGIACAPSCIFTAWSDWTTCGVDCMQTRSRTLEMGEEDACVAEYGALELTQICEGGQCNVDPPTSTPTTAKPVDVPTDPEPETGCRIDNVDTTSRPSSKGFKAVGVQQDCASRCSQETQFACEAYMTTGPGGPCFLFGAIDQTTTILQNSKYYMQDIKCAANSSPQTGLCQWQKTGTVPSPDEVSAKAFKGVGFTINAPHCGTLCMMNHPMFKPRPCQAYAYNPSIALPVFADNCYFFEPPVNFTSSGGGVLDLYELVCSNN